MIGTIVNIIAIIIGSSIGLLIHKNLPDRLVKVTFQIMGLFTLVLGMSMALESNNLLVMVFSLIVGALIGTAGRFDDKVQGLSDQLGKRLGGGNSQKFSKGFLTSFLLFCVGSMTILGAIEEGMNDNADLLLIKSLMDGFSSIALTVAFGIGVMFSVIPLLIFQGGLTLLAAWLGSFMSPDYITEISAVGGVILLALGLNLLEITKIKIIDLLPALIFTPLFLWLYGFLPV